jgi:hypothetical protein
LLDSLRVQGEREHQLSKTLTELQPLLVAAMQRDAATAAAGGVVADGSPPAEVQELSTTNSGDGSGAGGAEEDAEAPEHNYVNHCAEFVSYIWGGAGWRAPA